MHKFSPYVVQNFISILVGQLGNTHNMYPKYGAWLYNNTSYISKRYDGGVYTLDMSKAICVYTGNVRSLYLYGDPLPPVVSYDKLKGFTSVK